jgi:hypothetical protein
MAFGVLTADFWTRGTGKAMRGQKDVQVLAAYLLSSPHANLLGLYYLPRPTACHETGLTPDEFDAAMVWLENPPDDPSRPFARYDREAELVWVVRMVGYRLGGVDHLMQNDNRVRAIRRELTRFRGHRFARAFIDLYGKAYSLGELFAEGFVVEGPITPPKGSPLPAPAPSKGPEEPGDQPPQPTPPKGGGEAPWTPPEGVGALVTPPSNSGSGSRSRSGHTEGARAGDPPAAPGPEPLTGYAVQLMFAAMRRRVFPDTLPWAIPADGGGKASTFAARLDPATIADLGATMRLAWQRIADRAPGWDDPRLAKNPSFAFGAWMSKLTELREELHGLAPPVAPPPRSRPASMPPVYTGQEPP